MTSDNTIRMFNPVVQLFKPAQKNENETSKDTNIKYQEEKVEDDKHIEQNDAIKAQQQEWMKALMRRCSEEETEKRMLDKIQ